MALPQPPQRDHGVWVQLSLSEWKRYPKNPDGTPNTLAKPYETWRPPVAASVDRGKDLPDTGGGGGKGGFGGEEAKKEKPSANVDRDAGGRPPGDGWRWDEERKLWFRNLYKPGSKVSTGQQYGRDGKIVETWGVGTPSPEGNSSSDTPTTSSPPLVGPGGPGISGPNYPSGTPGGPGGDYKPGVGKIVYFRHSGGGWQRVGKDGTLFETHYYATNSNRPPGSAIPRDVTSGTEIASTPPPSSPDMNKPLGTPQDQPSGSPGTPTNQPTPRPGDVVPPEEKPQAVSIPDNLSHMAGGPGFSGTMQAAEPYRGGTGIVKSFFGANGSRFDITETGAVIQANAHGGNHYRAGWIDPSKMDQYNSVDDLKGNIKPGASGNPYTQSAPQPPLSTPATPDGVPPEPQEVSRTISVSNGGTLQPPQPTLQPLPPVNEPPKPPAAAPPNLLPANSPEKSLAADLFGNGVTDPFATEPASPMGKYYDPPKAGFPDAAGPNFDADDIYRPGRANLTGGGGHGAF